MRGFLDVNRVRVPRVCAEEAHAHLELVGHQGFEAFALWAGKLDGDTFNVFKTIIPDQRGLRTDLGVCVTVAGDELHRINVWLFQHDMTLIAQLHSHPTDAYHSETDDTYPIATTVGSLSLVIPNFAREPFSLENCAIYRLMPPDNWVKLTVGESDRLIILEDQAEWL